MKILAIIVTYYPEKDLLERNIKAFADKVDKVIIWENTPECDKERFRSLRFSNIAYFGDGINSISHALNFAWEYAKQNGYDYLLTMDQDSLWENFENFIYQISSDEIPYGIYGPAMEEIPSGQKYLIKNSIITSGTLISIKILDIIGGYYEKFDIDGIDVELCFRARQFGFHSYMINGCYLVQRFGIPSSTMFLSKSYQMDNYSPSRLYSQARSKIIIYRKYKISFYYKLILLYLLCIYKPYLIIIGEKNKFLKISSIYKGVLSGFFCRDINPVFKAVKIY